MWGDDDERGNDEEQFHPPHLTSHNNYYRLFEGRLLGKGVFSKKGKARRGGTAATSKLKRKMGSGLVAKPKIPRLKTREFKKLQKRRAAEQRERLEGAAVNLTGLSAKQKRFVKRAIKRVQRRAKIKRQASKIIDSRFPGVSIDHTETLWKAQVYWNDTVIFVGRYRTENDAWMVAKRYRTQLGWPELKPMPASVWEELGGEEGSILASELPKEYSYLRIPTPNPLLHQNRPRFGGGGGVRSSVEKSASATTKVAAPSPMKQQRFLNRTNSLVVWPKPEFNVQHHKRRRASSTSKKRRSKKGRRKAAAARYH
mmetsp:Transcript_7085/g.11676  ORF Transcript_7085/g.11676 Transcript_7085/m.11676 type:complete len:312 (-) Transcript_7085:81-1016(-)